MRNGSTLQPVSCVRPAWVKVCPSCLVQCLSLGRANIKFLCKWGKSAAETVQASVIFMGISSYKTITGTTASKVGKTHCKVSLTVGNLNFHEGWDNSDRTTDEMGLDKMDAESQQCCKSHGYDSATILGIKTNGTLATATIFSTLWLLVLPYNKNGALGSCFATLEGITCSATAGLHIIPRAALHACL